VHIAEILDRRHVAAAGLFLSLTRRCPLSCAHCSTNSTVRSEEHSGAPFLRLVDSFTSQSHPELVFLTGGEALLRQSVVRSVIGAARRSGTATVLISGLFFARKRAVVPDRIMDLLRTLDHVVISHDKFHAPEVPRGHALDVAAQLRAAGIDVSFQLVSAGPDDSYLADSVAAIRERFDDEVPALVARLGAVGRGAALFEAARIASPAEGAAGVADTGASADGAIAGRTVTAAPCVMAAWPTVAYDGTVVACCSQDIVDGPAPEHLVLGHAARDPWDVIARRCRERPALRAIRVYGPRALTEKYQPGCGSGEYCATCKRIGERPAVLAGADTMVAGPAFVTMEALTRLSLDAGGARAFARAYGVPDYAGMATLGQRGPATASLPAGGTR
jgi:4Fe-4S single cluster domain